MGDWQLIETAPRDGTLVLLYARWAGKRTMVTARWLNAEVEWTAELGPTLIRATHWHPLVEPPTDG